MIRICIVGEIGSGKSYIYKHFGFPVFNADLEVNKIYKKNRNCFKKLNKIFPNYIYSFPIKKKEIVEVILKKNENIKKINKVVHYEVRLLMNKFLKKNKKKKFVVLDIPLLLENKINNKKDILIFVKAKRIEIKKRLKKRKNFNQLIFKRLQKLQLSIESKKKKSNYIIKNNFKSTSIRKNVKLLKNKILIK